MIVLGGLLAAGVLGPLLLPWLPGRAFSAKGVWIGLAMSLVLALCSSWSSVPGTIGALQFLEQRSGDNLMVSDDAGSDEFCRDELYRGFYVHIAVRSKAGDESSCACTVDLCRGGRRIVAGGAFCLRLEKKVWPLWGSFNILKMWSHLSLMPKNASAARNVRKFVLMEFLSLRMGRRK
ncbi:MAG: hypothetical protein ACYTE3_31715 [Planctomycetota bacterium]